MIEMNVLPSENKVSVVLSKQKCLSYGEHLLGNDRQNFNVDPVELIKASP